MKKFLTLVSVLMVVSFVLAACGTKTETPAVVETAAPSTEPAKLSFTTPHPILSDLRVRQALAYCTDKVSLVKSVYPLNDEAANERLPMNTFIPSVQWAYAGDENITIYPFDPDKGGALLDEAGWTVNEDDGYRYNANGDALLLHFTTTNAAFRQTWSAVWERQMKNCGILIVRQMVPASWWFGDSTGLAHRDFELGAFAWVGQPDPGGQTLYACDQIPTVENGWVGQNDMGWCNQLASDNIKIANNTLIKADRKAAYTIVQQEFTKDVPSIPLFNRASYVAYDVNFTGLSMAPGDQDYYTWNPWEWEIPGKDTIVLGFTQEPSTLFQPIVDAFVAKIAGYLVSGLPYTSQNFDFQPVEQDGLSTIESGLSTNADFEAKAGDTVVDSSGNIVVLDAAADPAIVVNNAAGEVVTFTGDPITMKQMTSKYQFISGMTFSDGVPLAQEDLELGYKVACDKEVGATSYILCDMVKDITFDGLTYTVTWWPGRQDPLYFLPPFGWYPAHQIIETEGTYKGMKLGDVPPKDFSTLEEIAVKPMDVGAYMITEWVKGEFIRYAVNPYFYGPAPKTPNIVIQIITPENAEAQLIAGQVDMIDMTTLTAISQTLKDAADAGLIKVDVLTSATWEHIDINLFVK